MAKNKIDELIKSLYEVANQSEEARGDTLDALRDLQRSLATRNDIYNRIETMNMELSISRIAQDLNIYQIFSENEQPINVETLAAKVGAAPLLTRRILRFLASVGQLKETGPDTYTANEETKVLAEPGFRGHIYHQFDNISSVLQVLPDFLAERKYQDIDDSAVTAAQKAFDTPLPIFDWIPSQPERFQNFQMTMTVQPRGAPWFSAFPFKEELGSFTGDVVFVDIGGGFGHQSAQLVGAHPELRDKVVLEDLSDTLDRGSPTEGVKSIAHDFFNEQPIKGAKFYYLRQVLHDWPDDKAITILNHIREAFGPDSQLLIDEMVIPNVGAHEQATNVDMIMMSCLGSIERTSDDWHNLLKAAKFRIQRIDTHYPRRQNSIIQAVPI